MTHYIMCHRLKDLMLLLKSPSFVNMRSIIVYCKFQVKLPQPKVQLLFDTIQYCIYNLFHVILNRQKRIMFVSTCVITTLMPRLAFHL